MPPHRLYTSQADQQHRAFFPLMQSNQLIAQNSLKQLRLKSPSAESPDAVSSHVLKAVTFPFSGSHAYSLESRQAEVCVFANHK